MHSPHSMQPFRRWPGSAEVGVGDLDARLAEEDSDRGRHEGLGDPHLLGDRAHHLVGRGDGRVRDHAEHALCLVVERGELASPVGDVAPTRVGEEPRERVIERVGVYERTPADPGTREHHDVSQQGYPLDTEKAETRREEKRAQVPRRLRQARLVKAASRFQDAYPVALLRQAESGGAAPKAAADNNDVVILVGHREMIEERRPAAGLGTSSPGGWAGDLAGQSPDDSTHPARRRWLAAVLPGERQSSGAGLSGGLGRGRPPGHVSAARLPDRGRSGARSRLWWPSPRAS